MADNTLIPKTKVRLQPFITIYAAQQAKYGDLYSQDETALSAEAYGAPIGAVMELTINNERPANFWRELNLERSGGKIAETYPGLAKYDLKVKSVVLYSAHMLDSFKAVADNHAGGEALEADVMNQLVPLTLRVALPAPVGEPVRTFYIEGCWFKNNNIKFDVMDDDTRTVQEGEMIAARITGNYADGVVNV